MMDIRFKTPKSFLIEFGMSTEGSMSNIGYKGTTPLFSPLSVLNKYDGLKEWYSTKDTDLSALALSVAWLTQPGDCPWKSPMQPDYDQQPYEAVKDWANERLEIAVALLRDEVDHDTIWFWDALQNYVGSDETDLKCLSFMRCLKRKKK